VSHLNDMNAADQRLVAAVLNGDRQAFAVVIKQTEGLVAQLIFKMIHNPGDRKDIAQDVYLKAFKNLGGFKFRSKLSTWIGQITYNTCLHYLEKKKFTLLENFGQDENSAENQLPDDQENAEALFSASELKGILIAELDKLQPLYQTLISLYHQQELSYAEIAEITSLPEGTVKSYIFRARKILKENILSKYQRDEL
jgi:RNA polymerase sigma factor (sigma-70 family)